VPQPIHCLTGFRHSKCCALGISPPPIATSLVFRHDSLVGVGIGFGKDGLRASTHPLPLCPRRCAVRRRRSRSPGGAWRHRQENLPLRHPRASPADHRMPCGCRGDARQGRSGDVHQGRASPANSASGTAPRGRNSTPRDRRLDTDRTRGLVPHVPAPSTNANNSRDVGLGAVPSPRVPNSGGDRVNRVVGVLITR